MYEAYQPSLVPLRYLVKLTAGLRSQLHLKKINNTKPTAINPAYNPTNTGWRK
ncbi:hypothetical protein ONA24_01970 [Mycoplasmopsis cynos]|uniref:hypothetical protein n=1 Tax=Mycoplasmopsis cynos TaxID=171284 RepID=UPI0024C6FEEF|nr:hypothetical protein [Mycoplasmopsis cynos]WAM10051.1 hypothetical protein ONA24_01970 [Mycoplasmopsis cynos]